MEKKKSVKKAKDINYKKIIIPIAVLLLIIVFLVIKHPIDNIKKPSNTSSSEEVHTYKKFTKLDALLLNNTNKTAKVNGKDVKLKVENGHLYVNDKSTVEYYSNFVFISDYLIFVVYENDGFKYTVLDEDGKVLYKQEDKKNVYGYITLNNGNVVAGLKVKECKEAGVCSSDHEYAFKYDGKKIILEEK